MRSTPLSLSEQHAHTCVPCSVGGYAQLQCFVHAYIAKSRWGHYPIWTSPGALTSKHAKIAAQILCQHWCMQEKWLRQTCWYMGNIYSKYILGGVSPTCTLMGYASIWGDQAEQLQKQVQHTEANHSQYNVTALYRPKQREQKFPSEHQSHTTPKLHELQSALHILNTQNHTKAVSFCH